MTKIMIEISDDDYESIKRGMRYKDTIADIMQQIENAEPVLSSSEKPNKQNFIECTVLDKIRTEIEQFAKNPNFGNLSTGASCGAVKAIEIINKYMSEGSEE